MRPFPEPDICARESALVISSLNNQSGRNGFLCDCKANRVWSFMYFNLKNPGYGHSNHKAVPLKVKHILHHEIIELS